MYTRNFDNLILNADSYKTSHWLQYPPGSEYMSSYVEARRGEFDVLFFGMQAFIKEYLSKPITTADIDEAEEMITAHGLPFNREGWDLLVARHGGLLPVRIQAVSEGLVVPVSNVVCQIVNTDPDFYWLPSYLETALLRGIWYPSTVASLSYYCKGILKSALQKSADTTDGLPFKLHDFGARGASSMETVALGSLAHLVNFAGTDSMSALVGASRWYGTIDAICSHHEPLNDTAKKAPFADATPGISNFDTFMALGCKLVRDKVLTAEQLVEKVCLAPARIAGIESQYAEVGGTIVVDQSLEWQVTRESMQSNGKNTPFLNQTLRGKVTESYFG